ncbi:MAG TPA: DUF4340 domain-containing protein [Armatimonadetes bacterium]|nr:DUF4340 domain-containing protein [Armatimonadota bacterium]
MKPWKTLLLAVIFIGLLLYVVKFERGEVPEKDVEKQLARLLDFGAAEKVTKLEIVGEEGKFVLEKKDDQWRLLEPVKDQADQENVDRLVKDIAERKAERVISAEDAGDDWAIYGLTEPKYHLTVWTEKGEAGTLLIGDKNPTGNSYYAQVKGQDSLLLFPTYFINTNIVNKKVKDLRDKTLLAFETEEVTRLRLAHEGTVIECAKEGEEWQLTAPLKAKADEAEIDTLLTAVHDLKIDDFVEEEAADLTPYGLDQPQATVVLTLGAKGENALLLGKKKEGDTDTYTTKLYAKRRGDKRVFLVNGDILDKLRKEPKDLRDKKILDFEKDQATHLVITKAGQTVELKRTQKAEGEKEEEWQLVQPVKLQADTEKVSDILYALRDLRATDFIDNPSDLAPYQLVSPRAEVTLTVEERKEPLKLLVGKKAADGTGLFVMRPGTSVVYKVRTGFWDDLETDVAKLRNLLVLKFDRTEVRRITLVHEDQKVVLQRKGEYDWQVVEPEKFNADSIKVGDVLYRLEDLRGDEYVTDKAEDLAIYGLDKPQVKAIVEFKDRTTKTILIGKRKEGTTKVYLKRADRDPIYLEDDLILTDLQREAKDFKKSPPPRPPY